MGFVDLHLAVLKNRLRLSTDKINNLETDSVTGYLMHYRKVASTSPSCLEVHAGFIR